MDSYKISVIGIWCFQSFIRVIMVFVNVRRGINGELLNIWMIFIYVGQCDFIELCIYVYAIYYLE